MKYTGPVPQRTYTTDPKADLAHGCQVIVYNDGFLLGRVRSMHPEGRKSITVDIDGATRRYRRAWAHETALRWVSEVVRTGTSLAQVLGGGSDERPTGAAPLASGRACTDQVTRRRGS